MAGKGRLESIDFVRGLAMIIMALDHTRDYFGNSTLNLDVTDPSFAAIMLYLTRLVTNFCAPSFVFLAGTSAFLSSRKMTRPQLSRFLVSRGLWLMFLELTILLFAWQFNTQVEKIYLATIWAIGCSMLALASLIFLPMVWIRVVATLLIFGHNALDGISPEVFGSMGWLWKVLHVAHGEIHAGVTIVTFYPVLPWIGVMAVGYGFGPVFAMSSLQRKRVLTSTGLASIAGFFALRFVNMYGDPTPWKYLSTPWNTVLSFLDCTKYPPSLSFVLMTLGVMFLVLRLANDSVARRWQPVVAFGRVPLFYYILHLYLIHGAATLLAWFQTGDYKWMFGLFVSVRRPAEFGFALAGVYAVWILIVLFLYPICKAYGDYKRRNTSVWLSYL